MSIQLSYEELDGYIQQICSGEKLAQIKNKSGKDTPVVFVYPSNRDKQVAEIVYQEAILEAEREGLPSLSEMETIIRSRGIFTEEDDAQVEKLRSKIEGQKAILAKTTKVPARRARIIDNIKQLEKEVDLVLLKKESSLEMSRERKAIEAKFLYLAFRNTYRPIFMTPFWESKQQFDDEPDAYFRKRLFVEYTVFCHGLSQDKIRYIARSNLWRIRYITAIKTGDSLFGRSIADYNVDQLMLLYWSHFYQSVYEMMPDERPPDSIIEDDRALDAYMKDWHADRNRDAAASRAKSNKKFGQQSAWDYDETLVMKSNPMHQDIEYSETLVERGMSAGKKTLDAAPIGKENRQSNPLIKKR